VPVIQTQPHAAVYTRKQWSLAYLAGLGNKKPHPYVLNWVWAWTQFETAEPPGAYFNLLNTTQQGHGGYIGDNIQGPARAAGVKDHPTFEDGIAANVQVSKYGLYSHLYGALAGNDITSLSGPSHAIQRELGIWGTGNGVGIAHLASNPSALKTDQFPGSGKVSRKEYQTGSSTADTAAVKAKEYFQNVHVAPDESVGQLLYAMDVALQIQNPFAVAPGGSVISSINIGPIQIQTPISAPDPLTYLGDVAEGILQNFSAVFIRGIFLFLGIVVIVLVFQTTLLGQVSKLLEPIGGISGGIEKLGAVA